MFTVFEWFISLFMEIKAHKSSCFSYRFIYFYFQTIKKSVQPFTYFRFTIFISSKENLWQRHVLIILEHDFFFFFLAKYATFYHVVSREDLYFIFLWDILFCCMSLSTSVYTWAIIYGSTIFAWQSSLYFLSFSRFQQVMIYVWWL